jgi:HNH endonuclease
MLKRDGYRCTATDCSTPSRGLGSRLVVDHVIERRDGGADHLSNLRTTYVMREALILPGVVLKRR